MPIYTPTDYEPVPPGLYTARLEKIEEATSQHGIYYRWQFIIEDDSEYSQAGLPQYADLGAELPRTECLKDVIARFLPYWESDITADLRAGRTVLVAAHGNSLRALVKHLDQISDEDIAGLNIPTGMPLVYELDDDLAPTVRGGRYLDPDAAAEAAAAVANQGR